MSQFLKFLSYKQSILYEVVSPDFMDYWFIRKIRYWLIEKWNVYISLENRMELKRPYLRDATKT